MLAWGFGALSAPAAMSLAGLAWNRVLAGGVLACMKNAPMFLADGAVSAEQANYIKSNKADSLYVLGGIGAVSEKLVQSISAAGSV